MRWTGISNIAQPVVGWGLCPHENRRTRDASPKAGPHDARRPPIGPGFFPVFTTDPFDTYVETTIFATCRLRRRPGVAGRNVGPQPDR